MSIEEIELYVTVKHQTDDAIKVDNLDGDEEWIPKSLISDHDVDFFQVEQGTIFVPEWLAADKGMI